MIRTPFFGCKYLPATKAHSQFCFIVSTKVSKKAVERNLIRRRLKEAFRLQLSHLEIPVLAVIIGQANGATCDFEKLEKTVQNCFQDISKQNKKSLPPTS